MADLFKELLSHARYRCLLVAKAFYFLPKQHAKFPVLNHRAMRAFACIAASKKVTKLVRKLFERLGLAAEQVELPERGLPFWLPFSINRFDFKIQNLSRSNDSQRDLF